MTLKQAFLEIHEILENAQVDHALIGGFALAIGLKIQAYCNNPRRELQDKADIQFLFERYPNMDMNRVEKYAEVFKQWKIIQNLKPKK